MNKLTLELLRTNVSEWNRLCSEGETLPDLRKTNLCGFNLSGANLSKVSLKGAHFNGADLCGTKIDIKWFHPGSGAFGLPVIVEEGE